MTQTIASTHLRTTGLHLLLTTCLGWCFATIPLIGRAQTAGTLRWKLTPEVPGTWTGASIGPDGTVYVSLCVRATNGVVYALDGASGKIKWQLRSACFASTPAVGNNGIVYVGGGDHRLYALAAGDGSVRWTFSAGNSFEASPAIGVDGTVYIGCNDNNLYALEGTNGAKRWAFTTGGQVHEAPAIGVDGTVYAGSADGKLYALNGSTGLKKWAFTTGGPVICSPAVGDDGTVYFGSGDHKVYAVNGATGTKRWEYLTEAAVDWSPALADYMVVIGSNDGVMYSLEADTGETCWSLVFGSPFSRAHPAFGTDGNLYFGGPGWVVGLDHVTKDPAWLFITPTTNNLATVIGADGTVYFGGDAGPFYAVWSGSLGGLGQSPWPASGQNVRRTGQVPSAPRILNQPKSQVVKAGGTATLTAIAVGTAPLSFQWQLNGQRVGNATNTALILTNLAAPMLGDYTLVIANALGSVTSDPAILGTNLAPVITLEPRDQVVAAGARVQFSVAASSNLPLGYQWQLDTTNLVGATQPDLSLTNVTPANAGVYRALVSNDQGSILSSNATLLVVIPATLAIEVDGQVTLAGTVGGTYRLESAHDLENASWESVTNLTLLNSPTTFWLGATNTSRAFYRAITTE